jgi:hypothetical protein
MRKMGNSLAMPLFAVMMAASLAFGINTALAQPRETAICTYQPPTVVGPCSDFAACQQYCAE